MTKATRKQTKGKKRKVQEQGEYEVTVKDTSPGSTTPSTTKTVKSASASQAVDTAIDPQDAGDAESIEVKKKQNTPGVPETPQVNQAESSTPRINMKQITEAVEYPYTVFLPRQFEQFLESIKLESKMVGHGLMLKFDSKTRLTEALRVLKKSNNPKASIILNGIKESIR